MKLDRRFTNGLAWAGALLVIGIPAADFVTGTFAGTPSVAVVDAEAEAPTTDATKPVTAATTSPSTPASTKPQAVANVDPVGGLLQSGKPLPSYITGGDAPATPAKPVATTPAKPANAPAVQQPSQPAQASTPAVTPTRPTITTPDQQVAALPAKVAPTPMPLSMRPRPVSVPLASTEPPLIIDQPTVANTLPPASLPQAQQMPNDFVTSQDLDTWESGPLSDFLANRNRRSSANYTVQQNVPPPPPEPVYGYDSSGFWLDQAPQGDRPIGRYEDDVIYLPY